MEQKKKQIAILGSTGSIGTQALEVINEHPGLFEVEVLTANNNSALLIEQAKKFKPNCISKVLFLNFAFFSILSISVICAKGQKLTELIPRIT